MPTAARPPAATAEHRTVDVDVQDLQARGRTVTGYAAVYNVESRDLGGFRERIAPGAFQTILDSDADVRCLLNHDPNIVLGRTRSGTLRLRDEQRGLRFECDLPESREDLREAVSRGDLDGASFRFEVGADQWAGEVRTISEIHALHDVSLATHPAYPAASVEMRTLRPRSSTESAPRELGGLIVRDRPSRSTVRTAARTRSLADEFRAAGFPGAHGERATLDWGRVDPMGPGLERVTESRALTWSGDDTLLNDTRRQIPPMAFDQRWLFTALRRLAVDGATTAVSVLTQTGRDLADASDVVRALASVEAKPETDSTVDLTQEDMHQVANIQTDIPNIYLAQPGFDSIIENDLRLGLYGGLDSLVLAGVAGADNQAPSGDLLIVSVRKAITALQALGYSPDTVVLTPAAAEGLDTLVSGITGATADWATIPSWFNQLRRVVSKTIPAPAVLDASVFGTLYVSPVSVARFEVDDGTTNRSNVRMECNAAFGVERQDAALRIAAS
jgi:Escherichia/Staphylococcus phage prohead protease